MQDNRPSRRDELRVAAAGAAGFAGIAPFAHAQPWPTNRVMMILPLKTSSGLAATATPGNAKRDAAKDARVEKTRVRAIRLCMQCSRVAVGETATMIGQAARKTPECRP